MERLTGIVMLLMMGYVMGISSDLEKLSDDELIRYEKSLLTIKKHVPALFCGLNVAQYRAFEAAYTPDKRSGLIPALDIVSFANGVGKTHLLILDMIGWCKGPDFLNWRAFPECAVDYWNSERVRELRDGGVLSLRLTCASDDMKADGSVLTIMKEVAPDFKFTAMDNSKCFRQIDVRHPYKGGVVNSIAVKTFDQDAIKHSGSTCQRIWVNEPLPGDLVGETVGRIRSKKGNPSGSILMCATLLAEASWVQELDNDPVLRTVLCRGHLYENCVSEEVTDSMAAEVRDTVGVTLEKLSSGGYKTNGVLSKSQIDTQIGLWRRTCPQELEARKSGSPISGGGRIYITYEPKVHEVEDSEYERIPEAWPAIQIVDPHGSRPSFSGWAVISPLDRIIFVREWPPVEGFGYYETIDTRRFTIKQECEQWDRSERMWGLHGKIAERIGDPNRFRENQPHANMKLLNLYAMEGFNFNVNIDDDLTSGHAEVSSYLFYDELIRSVNPLDMRALPHLFFCKGCENLIRAMQNYAMKKGGRRDSSVTENVSQKFKDGADIIRYAVVWAKNHPYGSIKFMKSGGSDYQSFRNGRIPKQYRGESSGNGFNLKGRKLSNSGRTR